MGKVIAIDGPSGSGKSTISKKIADRLGYTYLDTGALYRSVALKLRNSSVPEDASDAEIASILKDTSVKVRDGDIYLDGALVGDEIRTTEIGHYSSVFSARKVVRDFLFDIQRSASDDNDIVAEGRDMTTVVFPDAYRKFFLTASDEERAGRRFRQLKDKGMDITVQQAMDDVKKRDERDSNRDIAPLKKAEDATMIDTSSMSIEQTIDIILEHITG
ncbi:MAG: (d)CMP kinase [Nitrospirota bacterium]|nr:MAG: (d)CMP kinase [Nitrospirota bacterium]